MTQIINVTKLHQLISDIEASLEERDGPRWFRGCGNFPNHRLEPTLLRHPKIRSGETTPLIVEQNLKIASAKQAHHFFQIRPQRISIGFFFNSIMAYQLDYWIGLKILSSHFILLEQQSD